MSLARFRRRRWQAIGFALACALAQTGQAEGNRTLGVRVDTLCRIEVSVAEDGESCFSRRCDRGASKFLGCDVSAMRQVVDIAASDSGRWLAVLSVGEGHPMLELVDRNLWVEQGRYTPRLTLNPYPGTINLSGFDGDSLRVESDIDLRQLPLDGHIGAGLMPHELQRFRIDFRRGRFRVVRDAGR